jgi:hypothetical protein
MEAVDPDGDKLHQDYYTEFSDPVWLVITNSLGGESPYGFKDKVNFTGRYFELKVVKELVGMEYKMTAISNDGLQ